MKKTISILALILLGVTGINAQSSESESTSERKNEIMLSPIELIAYPLLNISYERLINEKSGVGINGMFYFGTNDNIDETGFTQVSPYYRMYFGKKYAAGFFVEGFVPITSTKDTYSRYSEGPYFNSYSEEVTRTTVGIGIGFGGKWITRNNIIFEVSAGLARRFGDTKKEINYYDSNNLTGRGMLGIGYRF